MLKRVFQIICSVGILSFLVAACVFPVTDFVQKDATSFITIEADITNEIGTSKIRITNSANRLQSVLMLPVTKATVYVTDEKGVQTIFKEGSVTGTYLPPAGFAGKVGSSYQMYVKTLLGTEYISDVETMNPVPALENVISQFEIYDQYPKGDLRRNGWSIYLDFKDNDRQGDFYQWNWKHYEKVQICATCTGGGLWNFSKNECNVPRVPNDQIWNFQCDGNCWDISWNNDINIFSDVLTNGQRIVGKQVARAPFDGYTDYYFRLEQRAITKSVYTYNQSIIASVQSNGTMFDVPAETKFSLNIKSKTNPTERILGVFNVYSVNKKIFYINRSNNIPKGENAIISPLIGEVYTCPPGAAGCQERVPCFESPTRTKIPPEGWNL